MPYRRRRFKKTYRRGRGRYGRYRRKRNYARGRRAVKVYAMRQSARKMRFRKAIQRALNVESKFHRVRNAQTDQFIGQDIAATSLNLVNRGSGPSERVGSQIAVNAIKFSCVLYPRSIMYAAAQLVADGAYPDRPFRFISFELWIDTQPEAGAITDLNALYEDTGLLANDPIAFRNRDYTSRYRKLKSFKYQLQPVAAASAGFELDGSANVDQSNTHVFLSGGGVRNYRKRFKRPLVIKFNPSDDATPTVTEVMNRNIFLIIRGYGALNVNADYAWNFQMDYTDV